MRILYISGETPITPAGGIATYLGNMVPAMRAAGHDVYLFTWLPEPDQPLSLDKSPFKSENTYICHLPEWKLRAQFPDAPLSHAVANYLLPALLRCIEAWDIDVIEATDFLSPAMALFQHLQTSKQNRRPLCATYYHGFVEDFFEADFLLPPAEKLRDLTGERQQCRISDLIIAPSQAARQRLSKYGVSAPTIEVVREPYNFVANVEASDIVPAVTYMGRISLSKGMDSVIYLVNAVNEVMPLERLRLIGRDVPTPFHRKEMRDYVQHRLCKSLQSRVEFLGFLPQEQALSLLEPGELAPHLGFAETFSYACIESIDQGLVPIVREGTPMSEFFPETLRNLVFPEKLGRPIEIQKRFERLCVDTQRWTGELQEFNRNELDPAKIAQDMTAVYEKASEDKKGRVVCAVNRAESTVDDVTIMIPAYRPGALFVETVDSVAAQSVGCPKVLICDDGTPEEDLDWFDYARMRLPDCTIVRQANGGLLAARNTLIAHLETPLAVYIDADDLLEPTYLERVLEAYNASLVSPDAVMTQRWNFDEGSERVLPDLLGDHMHLLFNDFRMTALIKADVLRTLGFDSLRRNGEADDWDFWLRFVAEGFCAAMVPEPLFRYRFRRGTMSWPWSPGQTMGTNAMLTETVGQLLAKRPEWGSLVAKALSNARVVG